MLFDSRRPHRSGPAANSDCRPGLQKYRASPAVFADDFGELARYRDANAALKPPAPGENRVVFFGDSITDIWHLDEYFPGKPYLNRGIGGQTTPQMLVRFRQDVIDLHPKVVVILAGTNDIAGNTGPMRLEDIEANYCFHGRTRARQPHPCRVFVGASGAQLHAAVAESFRRTAAGENPRTEPLAARTTVAANTDCLYLDYFSAMVDDKGLLKRDLAEDGLHPNAAGYKIMAPLAEAAIDKALGRSETLKTLFFAVQLYNGRSFRPPRPSGIPRPWRRGMFFFAPFA